MVLDQQIRITSCNDVLNGLVHGFARSLALVSFVFVTAEAERPAILTLEVLKLQLLRNS